MIINADYLYAVGDIHGEFDSILYNIKKHNIKDACILFAGDIGIGFNKTMYYQQIFTKITRELSKRKVHLIFVRGNHDDSEYFDGKHFNRYKNIHVVSDYTVIELYNSEDINTHNILCVGGATSIDRSYRKDWNANSIERYHRFHGTVPYDECVKLAPQCYWEHEQPIYDEEKLNEITNSGIKIDMVLTHTCPSFCQPLTKDGIMNWIARDNELFYDIDVERKTMDDIWNKIRADKHPLTKWVYGHYHYHNMEFVEDVKFTMLDMCRDGNFDIIDIR